jgi:hypothetical protein
MPRKTLVLTPFKGRPMDIRPGDRKTIVLDTLHADAHTGKPRDRKP